MTIAVIGVGNIGEAIAGNIAAGGTQVRLAARNLEHAQEVATRIGDNAHAGAVEDVLQESDTIVLPIPYTTIQEFVTTHRDALAGKVVIDTSNAVAPDADGNLAPFLDAGQSAGGNVASWLPDTARYAKAFNTLGSDFLRDSARQTPPVALFFAAEDPVAIEVTEQVIRAAGFDPVHIGGIDSIARIEAAKGGSDLHQFGGLGGRLIDAAEARALI